MYCVYVVLLYIPILCKITGRVHSISHNCMELMCHHCTNHVSIKCLMKILVTEQHTLTLACNVDSEVCIVYTSLNKLAYGTSTVMISVVSS